MEHWHPSMKYHAERDITAILQASSEPKEKKSFGEPGA
jgi:hypothetical protein